MRTESKAKVFRGVPSWFRACCHEVKRRGVAAGYDYPAHQLMLVIDSYAPMTIEEDDWEVEVDGLMKLIETKDDKAVLAWFDHFYPKCMKLVPRQRRANFLKGIYRGAKER